jgi:hypothetical protein
MAISYLSDSNLKGNFVRTTKRLQYVLQIDFYVLSKRKQTMSDNKRNISEDPESRKGEGVSGLGKGKQTGPEAGGADNTRGENKPSHQGSSGGAKHGKDNPNQQNSPQGSNANPTTTSRGADSTDKEFRNNQPNPSTITDPKMKNKDKNN